MITQTGTESELIYRQQAIDAFYESFCYAYCDNCEKGTIDDNEDLCGDCHRKYQNWSASKQTIEKVINNLPSAQPIIRCKDCKYWKRSSCCEGYCAEIDMEGFDEDHYCGFAERRE